MMRDVSEEGMDQVGEGRHEPCKLVSPWQAGQQAT
jgi:hypothetical protein